MNDLLVKLYDLPPLQVPDDRSFLVRRPIAPERSVVADWVAARFSPRWGDEVKVAFANHPPTCFVAQATDTRHLLGFACYNGVFQGFFGPTGVDEAARNDGIGTALLLRCLHAMRESGHAYAIIGAASSNDFYQEAVGAIVIPDSDPGAYANQVNPPPK